MLTPRSYQVEAINRGLRQDLLIADQCGLGKTLQAIEIAKGLRAALCKPVLIIVTKSIKAQWAKALEDQGVSSSDIVTLDAKGFSTKGEIGSSFVLAHYEAIVKHAAQLKGFYFSLIVADEAHKLRNRNIKRTQAVKGLRSFRRIAMTGTPWDGDPSQVWSILNWLDPSFYTSYWRFFTAHVNYTELRVRYAPKPIKQIVKDRPVKDLERFSTVLRRNMVRRTKAEVREDLPPRIEQVIPIEMSPDQAKIYNQIAKADDIITELEEGVEVSTPIMLTYILRLIQATTDPALLGSSASSAKLEWLLDWAEENKGIPFIVFTRFRETANKIADLLRGLDEPLSPVLITGGSKRPLIGPEHTCIVGTIAAMGEGLDLPHINTAIFIDVEWSSILMQQAIDRIHRINITEAKHVLYLQALGTVDQEVYNVVVNKWSVQDLVFNVIRGLIR